MFDVDEFIAEARDKGYTTSQVSKTTYLDKEVLKYQNNLSDLKFMQGKFKENTQYTLKTAVVRSGYQSKESAPFIDIKYTDGTTQLLYCDSSTTSYIESIATSRANKTIDYIYVADYAATQFIYLDLSVTQLEQGTTATDFVPHQEQNYPLTLGNIELNKIDTAQDYFYKKNNKWYLHKEIRKRTISSVSEVGTASSGIKYANIGSVPNALNNSYIYCENYINSSDASKNNSIRIAGVNLFVYDNRFTDVETALSLLNGLEYYHIMATPTETEITDTTLIEQLEATLQARSYDDITYITSTSDELGFSMDVESLGNINKVINDLLNN